VDLTQTIVNAVLLGVVGLILGRMFHGLRAELIGDIAGLRAELRDVRREIGELRSDLTQVALAVGARRRASRGS
jgi:hypothetical protein